MGTRNLTAISNAQNTFPPYPFAKAYKFVSRTIKSLKLQGEEK